jgi:hypothetical protein
LYGIQGFVKEHISLGISHNYGTLLCCGSNTLNNVVKKIQNNMLSDNVEKYTLVLLDKAHLFF